MPSGDEEKRPDAMQRQVKAARERARGKGAWLNDFKRLLSQRNYSAEQTSPHPGAGLHSG